MLGKDFMEEVDVEFFLINRYNGNTRRLVKGQGTSDFGAG